MAVNASSGAFWMERPSLTARVIKIVALIVIIAVMLFPFIYVLSVSLSSDRDLQGANVPLIPLHPTLGAYSTILQAGVVTSALGVSIGINAIGTLV